MQLLERRLDSVVFQMGFAPNRRTSINDYPWSCISKWEKVDIFI